MSQWNGDMMRSRHVESEFCKTFWSLVERRRGHRVPTLITASARQKMTSLHESWLQHQFHLVISSTFLDTYVLTEQYHYLPSSYDFKENFWPYNFCNWMSSSICCLSCTQPGKPVMHIATRTCHIYSHGHPQHVTWSSLSDLGDSMWHRPPQITVLQLFYAGSTNGQICRFASLGTHHLSTWTARISCTLFATKTPSTEGPLSTQESDTWVWPQSPPFDKQDISKFCHQGLQPSHVPISTAINS